MANTKDKTKDDIGSATECVKRDDVSLLEDHGDYELALRLALEECRPPPPPKNSPRGCATSKEKTTQKEEGDDETGSPSKLSVVEQEESDLALALDLAYAQQQEEESRSEAAAATEGLGDYELALWLAFSESGKATPKQSNVPEVQPHCTLLSLPFSSVTTTKQQHTTTVPPEPHVPAELYQRRTQSGQCGTCGVALVENSKHVKLGFFGVKILKTPTPRTEPGRARNGICLACRQPPQAHSAETMEDEIVCQFQCEVPNGPGYETEVIWKNGDHFVGNIQEDGYFTKGKMLFSDGSSFTGAWKNSKPHGFGTFRYANGTVYEGFFVDGVRQGTGKCSFSNGDVYNGEWSKNKLHGRGFYKYRRGPLQKFDGCFEWGQRARGKCVLRDGSVECFRFDNDWPSGEGVRWHASGILAWKVKANVKSSRRNRKRLRLEDAHAAGKAIQQL